MHKRLLFGALMGCIWPVGASMAQETGGPLVLTLARAEEMAFANNVQVRTARADLELAEAKKAQASHARFLPNFTLRDVVGPIPRARGVFTPTGVLTSPDTSTGLSDLRVFNELELNLLQPIYTFGKLGGLNSAAMFGVRAAESGIDRRRSEVQLQVRKLYWGLVLGYEMLDVVESAMKDFAEAEEKLQEKFDEGSDEVTQTDMFKLEIFRYEINKQHRQVLDQVELGKAALRAAIGLEPGRDFELDRHRLEPLPVNLDSLDTYTSLAVTRRPEISGLKAGMMARSSLVRATRSDYMPQFFFGAQIKYNRAQDRFDPRNPFVYNPTNYFRPGFVFGINWNLNLLQTRDKVRLARYEYNKLVQQESALVDGVRLDVQRAYLKVLQARQNLRESSKALKASENWMRSEAQTFDLGIGEVKDVIDAFRANGAMKAEHLKNIFEFNTALAELSKAVGTDLYPS